MTNGFIHLDLFKKRLCRSQFCVMCCGLVCIFLLVYIYNNFQSNSELIYQQDQNSEELKSTLPQADFRNDDSVSKLEKGYSKTEQKVKLPDKPGEENENKISSQKDNKQQKTKPDQLKENQNINQQKVVDKKPSQKENSQQKANSKPDQVKQNPVPGMNATHINGILMEPVNANYTRNIYFTMKTTHKFYANRLFPVMLTWLQVLDKNKLSIISDKSKQNYVDMFRRVGYQIEINDECEDKHSRWGLCCKMGTEFAAYYKAVEEHPDEKDKYQWFCHSDDDMYVNVPKLSHLLQQYDPHKPYYVGKWLSSHRKHPIGVGNEVAYNISHNMHLSLKQKSFRYATGSTFCISYAIMMEAKKFLNGAKPFNNMSELATSPYADDITVGFIIGALLGHNLTDVTAMTSQFDVYVRKSSLNAFTSEYLTISSSTTTNADKLRKLASSLKTPLPSGDPTRFLLYHCLLYPTISWCNSVRETLNTNGS